MAFTIPNVGVAGFPDQSEPDSVDIDILTAGHSITGVVSGCAVTAQGTPNMTVAVASGTISILGVNAAVAAGNVAIGAAHATLPRKDIVIVNTSGVKAVTQGTAAAQPLKPPIPGSTVVLAEVYVPAADTAISSTQITDKRVIVQAATSTQMHLIARKTADQSVSSATTGETLVNATDLTMPLGANEVWVFKWLLLMVENSGGAADIQIGHTCPAGATGVIQAASSAPMTDPTALFIPNARIEIAGAPNNMVVWGAGSPYLYSFDGIVTTTGTAGSLQVQFAQYQLNAALLTMKANSTIWGARLV